MAEKNTVDVKSTGVAGLLSATYHFMMSRIMDRLTLEGYRDLSKTQLHVLVRFDVNGMTLHQISQRVQISVQIVSNIVKMLATSGYVAEIEEGESLQGYKYALQKRGHEVAAIVRDEQSAVENAWREHMGDESLASVIASLEDLFEATALANQDSE